MVQWKNDRQRRWDCSGLGKVSPHLWKWMGCNKKPNCIARNGVSRWTEAMRMSGWVNESLRTNLERSFSVTLEWAFLGRCTYCNMKTYIRYIRYIRSDVDNQNPPYFFTITKRHGPGELQTGRKWTCEVYQKLRCATVDTNRQLTSWLLDPDVPMSIN